ncbi:hypothetical protein N0V82_004291 [Gnomoniopsis sp. IMI 355080]|nr:hypothetical protein N0V82_004291 [Gnomoniopsis sp. IMI 355080]
MVSVFILLVEIWLAAFFLKVAYRISPLHPLYQIPGPLLAKATYFYEVYFDLIKGGQYTQEIQRLHDIYGPLIQINPEGLHSNDPRFIDEVYSGGTRKRNKPFLYLKFLVGCTGQDHNLHRKRREPLNKFFSKASVSKTEHDIHSLAQQLGDKMLAAATHRKVFQFQDAVSCYTADVIGLFAFGDELGFLQQHGFVPNLKRASWPLFTTYYMCRWLDPVRFCFENFGAYVSRFMPKDLATYQNLLDVEIPSRISQIKAERDAAIIRKRQTAFDVLLDSSLLEHEKSDKRLQGEAGLFLIAGTDTTSWTLTVATFYLLQNSVLLAELTAELLTVVKDPRNLPRWSTLEQLPLLGGVVHEALRLGYGVPGRSPRIATHEDLIYRGFWTAPGATEPSEVAHVIPRGFNVGMSTLLLHHNEEVFPDSEEFLPERWLNEDGSRRKDLERFLFSFSKGSRGCLGKNLAYCEIYLALVVLVLRVFPRMQLYQTTIDDVKLVRDLLVPVIKDGRKGVQVLITD